MNDLQVLEPPDNLVAEIHAGFEYELNPGPATSTPETAADTRYRPDGMAPEQFADLVRHYRLHYPGQNFVTEAQVRELCLKYELVMGPECCFSEPVPERNRAEINAFRLLDADNTCAGADFGGAWFERYMAEFLASVSVRTGGGFRVERETVVTANLFLGNNNPDVLAIGDGIVLVYDTPGEYLMLFKTQVFGSEWLAYIDHVHIGAEFTVTVTREEVRLPRGWFDRDDVPVDPGPMRLRAEVVLRLRERVAARLRRLKIEGNVQRMVVAPARMFTDYAADTETRDDYRVCFKSPEPAGAPLTLFGPNDPIVLQPVPGGYLVLTKWGKEARLPEIQNAKAN